MFTFLRKPFIKINNIFRITEMSMLADHLSHPVARKLHAMPQLLVIYCSHGLASYTINIYGFIQADVIVL
jgi:hypothetical protein